MKSFNYLSMILYPLRNNSYFLANFYLLSSSVLDHVLCRSKKLTRRTENNLFSAFDSFFSFFFNICLCFEFPFRLQHVLHNIPYMFLLFPKKNTSFKVCLKCLKKQNIISRFKILFSTKSSLETHE